MTFILHVLNESWHILERSALYVLLGVLVAGLLKVYMNPAAVAAHLGHGRFISVIKAALFGIPIPLCSCGVLPARKP